jgi:proline dehydrogenase
MVNRVLITRRAAHRFVAGERLEEAVGTAADLDPVASAAFSNSWVMVRDLSGVGRAVDEHEEAARAIPDEIWIPRSPSGCPSRGRP